MEISPGVIQQIGVEMVLAEQTTVFRHIRTIGEVEVGAAVSGMMNVLRKHRVQIDPVFTVAHLAILVAEGLGKQLDPTIDMMPLAGPYLAKAMLEAPPARPPLRKVPVEASSVSLAAE